MLTWAAVSFGGALVMFVPGGAPAERREASLWFRTGDVDAVHASLARLQRERAASLLAGHSSPLPEIRFAQDLHDAFYGQREFTIIDPNGWELSFAQEIVR